MAKNQNKKRPAPLRDEYVEDQLERFVTKTPTLRNVHLGGQYMNLYVRKSKRPDHRALELGKSEYMEMLDLASFSVQDPDKRGSGVGTSLIRRAKALLKESDELDAIFIENLLDSYNEKTRTADPDMTKRRREWLERLGFVEYELVKGHPSDIPCFVYYKV